MGSHYYHPTTGELIDGDLRQARKVGALPSPTTVLNVLGSPGLKYYFRRQMWEAACTTPRAPGMSDEDHWDACQKFADEHGQAARDKGGDFHTLCQKFHERCMNGDAENFIMGFAAFNAPLQPQFDAYVDWYSKNVRRSLMVEQTVIGDGYAGRVDHVAELMDGRICCMDVKTQDTSKKKGRFNFYDQWPIQLGAYAGAIKPMPDCIMSIAVSANAPVVVEALVWPKPVDYYHKIFMGLLAFWCHSNEYHPS